jgi:hypothetical protein
MLLSFFVLLTIGFASLAAEESISKSTVTSTNTVTETSTATETTTVKTWACPSSMTCGSFVVSSPPSQVYVDSVRADLTAANVVVFGVTFENTESSLINFDNFSLNYSVPANSSVLKQVETAGFPGGSDIVVPVNLYSGQTYTLWTAYPSDKTFYYELVQPGTLNANLNVTWSTAGGQYTTVIFAKFDFGSS